MSHQFCITRRALPAAVLLTAGIAAGWGRLRYRRGWADGRHTGWHELAPTPGGCFLCDDAAAPPATGAYRNDRKDR
jgi:hypothetical protein